MFHNKHLLKLQIDIDMHDFGDYFNPFRAYTYSYGCLNYITELKKKKKKTLLRFRSPETRVIIQYIMHK